MAPLGPRTSLAFPSSIEGKADVAPVDLVVTLAVAGYLRRRNAGMSRTSPSSWRIGASSCGCEGDDSD